MKFPVSMVGSGSAGAIAPRSGGAGFYVVGIEQVVSNLHRALSHLHKTTNKGLVEGGKLIRNEAQKRTPRLTGQLRAHATVSWDGGSKPGDNFVVAVAYMEHYAVYQHEGFAYMHDEPWPVGWKFLERAISENYHNILMRVWAASRIP